MSGVAGCGTGSMCGSGGTGSVRGVSDGVGGSEGNTVCGGRSGSVDEGGGDVGSTGWIGNDVGDVGNDVGSTSWTGNDVGDVDNDVGKIGRAHV